MADSSPPPPLKRRKENISTGGDAIANGEQMSRETPAAEPVNDSFSFWKSVLKISLGDVSATGFLCQMDLKHSDAAERRTIHGILTNNQAVDESMIRSNKEFLVTFTNVGGSETEYKFPVESSRYCYTCPLLDATFLAVSDVEKEQWGTAGFQFLRTGDALTARNVTILLDSDSSGGEPAGAQAQHKIQEHWGVDFKHSASTELASSGSPIVGGGGVVGLQKKHTTKQEVNNVATNMKYIKDAIERDFSMDSAEPAPHSARSLTLNDIDNLRNIGLRPLNDSERSVLSELDYGKYLPHMFVSPQSRGITEIWFFRGSQFWYWSPPVTHNLFNWARISPTDQIKVTGGMWHNMEPASRNVRIIQSLVENGSSYIAIR